MVMRPKLLLVEDSANDAELLLRHLLRHGIEPMYERVETEVALVAALDSKEWDTVICDYNLPSLDALTAILVLKKKKPDMPCIVVSGSVGEEFAVATMRAGASDYIMKDNLLRLVPAIQRELKEAHFRRERRQMEEELRKKEDELRQAQKLEAIGQLAGGIAHDFNNILATILMQADVLIDSLDETQPSVKLIEYFKKGLEQIKKSGHRATNLTQQLLAFSRKQILQPKILNLNDLVIETEKMLKRVIEENIEFKTILAADLKNIKADVGHVEQILMNLVINSRDAMPAGGILTIETKNTHIDEVLAGACNVKPGPYVLLTVRDTGAGMSPEIQKHLFEPFFTTKPVGKGTGLGLCTVYGIVRQNNGLIFVESELGKGTVFKVYFSAGTEQVVAVAAPISLIVDTRGNETILVVEDEEDLRELVSETLKKNGYHVLIASNGSEALELLKSNKSSVHLILSDVVMPHMGGPELAKQARILDANIKILFQSGYTEDTLILNGINSGEIHFLAKPYVLKELLVKVREILGPRQATGGAAK